MSNLDDILDDWWSGWRRQTMTPEKARAYFYANLAEAYDNGAAVAFGLMGMAEAIGKNFAAKQWLDELARAIEEHGLGDDEACGWCLDCGAPFEVVRPGKEQPTCGCDDTRP